MNFSGAKIWHLEEYESLHLETVGFAYSKSDEPLSRKTSMEPRGMIRKTSKRIGDDFLFTRHLGRSMRSYWSVNLVFERWRMESEAFCEETKRWNAECARYGVFSRYARFVYSSWQAVQRFEGQIVKFSIEYWSLDLHIVQIYRLLLPYLGHRANTDEHTVFFNNV